MKPLHNEVLDVTSVWNTLKTSEILLPPCQHFHFTTGCLQATGDGGKCVCFAILPIPNPIQLNTISPMAYFRQELDIIRQNVRVLFSSDLHHSILQAYLT